MSVNLLKSGTLIFVLIILNALNLRSQNRSGINQTDAMGRKTGAWEARYPNGQLRYSGQFSQGRPVGEFKYYYESGKLRATNVFENNGLRAYHKAYSDNGLLVAEGVYFDQQKDSTWRFYSDLDGKLLSEDEFTDNLQHGISRSFFPDTEKLAELTTWQYGEKHGPWVRYFPDGTRMAEGSYNEDQPDGPVVFYHPNGQVHIRGNYRLGLKTGVWETFDEDGKLISKEEYKERGF
jgi:antitoxin component YwqK of YwqJK toxin-antitoxin module